MKRSRDYHFTHVVEQEQQQEQSFDALFDQVIAEQKELLGTDVSDYKVGRFYETLMDAGRAAEVTRDLKDKEFSQEDPWEVNILQRLAQEGQTDFVLEKIANWDMDAGIDEHMEIIVDLLCERTLEWVLEQIKEVRIHYTFSNATHMNLVNRLERMLPLERWEQIVLQNQEAGDLSAREVRTLLRYTDTGAINIAKAWLEVVRSDKKGIESMGKDEVVVILENVAGHQEGEWVMRFLNEVDEEMIDQTDRFGRSLFEQILRRGGMRQAAEEAERRGILLENPEDCRLLTICAEQDADWVIKQIEGKPIVFGSFRHRNVLTALIRNGKADFVMQLMAPEDLRPASGGVELCKSLAKNGKAKEVAKMFDRYLDERCPSRKDLEASMLVPQKEILFALALFGEQAWVEKTLEHADLHPDYQTRLIDGLLNSGMSAFVQRKIEKNLDLSIAAHQRLKDIMHFDITGEMPPIDKEGAREIAREVGVIRKKERQEVLERAERQLETLTIDGATLDLSLDTESFVNRLPNESMRFMRMALFSHPMLSKEMARAMDVLQGRRKKCVVGLGKTGSELRVMAEWVGEGKKKWLQTTFVNDIPEKGVSAWKEAAEKGIPVAPILGEKPINKTVGDHRWARVYSRYCGRSLLEVSDMTSDAPRFRQVLWFLRDRLRWQLEQLGITHGHTHQGNFTVEFVDKNYLAEQGGDVNNLPYKKDKFLFDFEEYAKHPDNWQLVMRVIDWDMAQSSSSKS